MGWRGHAKLSACLWPIAFLNLREGRAGNICLIACLIMEVAEADLRDHLRIVGVDNIGRLTIANTEKFPRISLAGCCIYIANKETIVAGQRNVKRRRTTGTSSHSKNFLLRARRLGRTPWRQVDSANLIRLPRWS